MIKKIQRKFIIITMLTIITVTICTFGIINTLNYISIKNEIDEVIKIIMDNNGKIPDNSIKSDDKYGIINEETPFSTRYFSITLNTKDEIENINMDNIAAIDYEKAKSMVKIVLNKNSVSGFYDNYKYKIINTKSYKLVVFLDCTHQINSFKSLIRISCIIIISVFLIVFIIIYVYSNRAIKPFVDNVEKQRQFITNASHELKTPLAVILADVDVLENQLGTDDEWLNSIRNQSNRLNILVKNLLNLANVDEKFKNINKSEFYINELMDEELESFKSLLIDKKVIFNNENNILINADKDLMRQLVVIFLDNAVKYTDENGIIKIDLTKTGKNVKIEFSNSCKHIKKINVERLFERFYRDDKSHNSKISGYGIGLSIAKSIVSLHCGKISAYKIKNNMICFKIII